MNKKFLSLLIISILFFSSNYLFAQDKIAFIDLNYVYANSKVGKKITKEVFWGENLPNLSDKLFKI